MRYGYEVEDEDDDCEDTISKVVADVMPEDFLMPCKCVKCARENVCSCRKHGLHCTATARLILAKTHMVFYSGDEFILDRKWYDCQNRIWILYI